MFALDPISRQKGGSTVEGDTLFIHAQKQGETKTEKGTYMRRERYEGEMSRSIALPTTVDPAKVEASHEHGLLKLTILNAQVAKPTQIPVKVKAPAEVA